MMMKTLRNATLALTAISALPAAAAGWQQFTNPDGTPWTQPQYEEFSASVTNQPATMVDGSGTEAVVENVRLVTRESQTYAYIEIDSYGYWEIDYNGNTLRTAGGLSYGTLKESPLYGPATAGSALENWTVRTISPQGTYTGWQSPAYKECTLQTCAPTKVFAADSLIQEGRVASAAARYIKKDEKMMVEGVEFFYTDNSDNQSMGTMAAKLRNAGFDHLTVGMEPDGSINDAITFIPSSYDDVNGPTYVAAYFRSQ